MKATLLAISLFGCCFNALASDTHHWSYEGEESPQNWSKLSPDFHLCEQGKSQSPVDIKDALETHPRPLKVSYSLPPYAVVNNGHSIQVDVHEGDYVMLDGEKFTLQQFHFHSPSENTINGKSFPLEAHYVHMDASGEIAVVAEMFDIGATNPELEKIWKQMPEKSGETAQLTSEIALNKLLPDNLTHYRFSGSLTTPPCTEGVRWLVLKQPQTLSKAQLEKFTHIMHHPNNRPKQALHGRLIVSE